ncbi:MAG TPA: RNA polymerase sigma factor [Woeseiaceae bacterium]|nr:RNA polymerase sigma factor [Woeseiaceae bacterium]
MQRREQEQQFRQWAHDHAAILQHITRGFAADADQEDLLQEILLAVWHAVPSYRGAASPSTFIYRIAQNTAMTWRRSVRYHEKTDELDAASPAAPPPDNKYARTRALYAGIRELPEADRSLLLLHLDELSYREIADVTGLSESNVGARLTRARKKLAMLMKENGA